VVLERPDLDNNPETSEAVREMAKNLDYRGDNSLTYRIVRNVFIVGTILLVLDYIKSNDWVTGIIGLVTAWVVKDGVTKAAEVYREK